MIDHDPRADVDDDSESAFWRNLRNDAGKDRTNFGDRNEWFTAEREKANAVRCRDCCASIGFDCRIVGSEPPQILRKFPAHQHRINDAKAAAE